MKDEIYRYNQRVIGLPTPLHSRMRSQAVVSLVTFLLLATLLPNFKQLPPLQAISDLMTSSDHYINSGAPAARQAEPHTHIREQKETYELIFSCVS